MHPTDFLSPSIPCGSCGDRDARCLAEPTSDVPLERVLNITNFADHPLTHIHNFLDVLTWPSLRGLGLMDQPCRLLAVRCGTERMNALRRLRINGL